MNFEPEPLDSRSRVKPNVRVERAARGRASAPQAQTLLARLRRARSTLSRTAPTRSYTASIAFGLELLFSTNCRVRFSVGCVHFGRWLWHLSPIDLSRPNATSRNASAAPSCNRVKYAICKPNGQVFTLTHANNVVVLPGFVGFTE